MAPTRIPTPSGRWEGMETSAWFDLTPHYGVLELHDELADARVKPTVRRASPKAETVATRREWQVSRSAPPGDSHVGAVRRRAVGRQLLGSLGIPGVVVVGG